MAFTARVLESIKRRLQGWSPTSPDEAPWADDIALHRRVMDPEHNAETTPPADEVVRVLSVWVLEAYPPSAAQALITGLNALGWGEPTFAQRDLVTAWVSDARRRALAGAWANLGVVVSTDTEGWPHVRKINLPEGVSMARGGIHQMTPSITILDMQFVLRENADSELTVELRTDYETYAEPLRSGTTYRIVTVEQQKAAAVFAKRDQIRRRCEEWIRRNIPGWFSVNSETGLPTCEFITTRRSRPFERSSDLANDRYLQVLDLDWRFDVWSSAQAPGLNLSLRSQRHDEEEWRWVLAGRDSDIFAGEDMTSYGGRDAGGLSLRADGFGHDMAAATLWAFSSALEQQLSRMRDAAANVNLHRPEHARAELGDLQLQILKYSRDAVALTTDLRSTATFPTPESHDFLPAEPFRTGEDLVKVLSAAARRQARWIRAMLANIEDALRTAADVLKSASDERLANSNLWLQRWVFILATLSLVGTVVQVWIALEQKSSSVLSLPPRPSLAEPQPAGPIPSRIIDR